MNKLVSTGFEYKYCTLMKNYSNTYSNSNAFLQLYLNYIMYGTVYHLLRL